MEFQNGSKILTLPGSESTIRGFSAPDLVAIDEAAFCSDDLITSILPMFVTRDDGRLILASSPHGKAGFFYEAWHNDESWKKVFVPWRDAPRIKESQVQFARAIIGELRYREEFECEFLDQAESVFPLELINNAFTDEVSAWL